MSDKDSKTNITISNGGIGLAGMFIMFWGDPDIADAIIHYLMRAAG